FCCDQCRNTYNNHKYADFSNQTRNINRILKNNRKILSDLFEKGIYKIHKEKLLKAGYNFDYLTSIYETKSKKTYHYCYDFGIAPIEEGWFLIVEKLEDLD
ncbi:MAG: hypothetical protein GX793_07420, partial [Bacteroidales bacterium]|nr:hypothetical protein [Bacteroidales bacterium]